MHEITQHMPSPWRILMGYLQLYNIFVRNSWRFALAFFMWVWVCIAVMVGVAVELGPIAKGFQWHAPIMLFFYCSPGYWLGLGSAWLAVHLSSWMWTNLW